jgi:signal transduction histidine kinase
MLPEPTNRIEHQYQQMMFVLYDLLQKNESELEKIHLEQVEYYTLWVHQIKTPISAMRLSLQHTTEDQEAVLEQELFKIEQYVELALQYTKIKNLSTDLVIDQYPLEEIIHQTVKKYASLFIYKKLSVNIHDFHTDVMTDSKWLSFILEQIISNAIKYTNRGGIEIWYTDHVLQIKDTGIGILKEDMDRLFEKGYTGYNGRIDKRASGIGLYLVKRVSDSLALKVEINSEVGQGTVVKIVFPEESNAFYYE